jgi:DNA-binding transcriptional ArsR family regulator
MNIYNKNSQTIKQVSNLLKELGTPARIRILLTVGRDEVCVCHLEATLGMRQAYLSQHLMALRKEGILITTRDGRFINYRLADPKILELIRLTAKILDISIIDPHTNPVNQRQCACPKCRQMNEAAVI